MGASPETAARDRNIAAACALLLLIGMPIAYLTDNPSTGDVIGLVVITAICLALLAWIVLCSYHGSVLAQTTAPPAPP